jgi:CTP synthase
MVREKNMKENKKTRFIFVTGGVISGVGKGITAASLGRLLVARGFSVVPLKIDPYLNEDAGTMNPLQHGEVFVTDDGLETDLDLGHYERFLSINLCRHSNFTSGNVLRSVLDKERRGNFLGKTIQFVPHVTDEIQERIKKVADEQRPDFLLVEIGGTMGEDMEIQPYAEAIRQFSLKVGRKRCCFIHVVKADYTIPADEEKTKPIQHSVRMMLGLGTSPDILVVRTKRKMEKENLKKLSLFCCMPPERIIESVNAPSIYELPLWLEEKGLADETLSSFGIKGRKADLREWRRRCGRLWSGKKITLGMVGKYHYHPDAYISVNEALDHAAADLGVSLKLAPIDSDSEQLEKEIRNTDGVIVPGGYGVRGTEGMIKAAGVAREKKIPYLGLCFGLQVAVVEFSRDVLNWRKANSTEVDPKTPYPVIDILAEQKETEHLGGTQRLGSYPAVLKKGTRVWDIYQKWHKGKGRIEERHRHRYEVNPDYHKQLTKAGLVLSGFSPDEKLVEFIELPKSKHPFFVATQAHPEFKSRFLEPHPLFVAFLRACVNRHKAGY